MPSPLTTNRRAKAAAIVEAFDRSLALCNRLSHGTDLVSMLRRAPDQWWRKLAQQARVNPPSNPADADLGVSLDTRNEVLRVYRDRGWGRGQPDVSAEFRANVRTAFEERAPAPAVARAPEYCCVICGVRDCHRAVCGEECGIRGLERYQVRGAA
jgi:hypothetical protein